MEEAVLRTPYVDLVFHGTWRSSAHTRTSLNDNAQCPYAHRIAHACVQALIDDGRYVPFLDVLLPKVRALAARGDCLVPCTLACDADITSEEEGDDRRNL